MTMQKEDEGIRAVREVREKISAEFGNDPEKLVEHYLEQQERYRDRLLRPIAVQQGSAVDEDPPRR